MSRRGVPATVAGGVVVMTALVVAALGRPVPLLSRPEDDDVTPPLPRDTVTQPSRSLPTLTQTPSTEVPDPSPLLVALVQVVLVVVVVILVALAVQLVRSLLRRRPHLAFHEEPNFAIPLVPSEKSRMKFTP